MVKMRQDIYNNEMKKARTIAEVTAAHKEQFEMMKGIVKELYAKNGEDFSKQVINFEGWKAKAQIHKMAYLCYMRALKTKNKKDREIAHCWSAIADFH